MQSQVSELSPVLVEVTIEVPWERVKKDLDEGFRIAGRNARVKGFRPGKAPTDVVRRVFGNQVRGEVRASLIEQGLVRAVHEHNLQIVSEPDVTIPSLEDGKTFTFSAKVEVRPKIEGVDTSRLTIEKPSAEITNAQVDEEIERLREQHAELRVPEPMRPACAGDELTVDYKVEIDGREMEDLAATDRPIQLGGENLIPEFEQGLMGSELGQQREITVTFASDHGRPDLRGKTAVFKVQVKELRERELPEVDDEFAKDVGEYETLLELRLKLRERLEMQAAVRAESELREKLIDKLIETNNVPVPPSLVHQQERQILSELASILRFSGQDMPMTEELHEEMHGRAERRVRAGLLLGALARQENLQVTPEEVEERLASIAQQSGKHIAKVRVEYQGNRREGLESELLEEKLMALLRSKAILRDAPEGAENARLSPNAPKDDTNEGRGAVVKDDAAQANAPSAQEETGE